MSGRIRKENRRAVYEKESPDSIEAIGAFHLTDLFLFRYVKDSEGAFIYTAPSPRSSYLRFWQFGMHASAYAGHEALRFPVGQFQVIPKDALVVGVNAVLDDGLCTFFRTLATEVGHTLFGDDDVDVVLRVVGMRNHRHDGADFAFMATDGQVKMEM